MKKIKEIKHLIGSLSENELSHKEITHRLIKFLLVQEKLGQAELARQIGAVHQNCNDVIRGLRKTEWIRRAIADFFDVSYRDLWGEKEDSEAA